MNLRTNASVPPPPVDPSPPVLLRHTARGRWLAPDHLSFKSTLTALTTARTTTADNRPRAAPNHLPTLSFFELTIATFLLLFCWASGACSLVLVAHAGPDITAMAGKWDAGMATWEHTPHGRGYTRSLAYFFHQTDYWSYNAEPWESHGCERPNATVVSPVLDLWESTGAATSEGPASAYRPAAHCDPKLAPYPADPTDCTYLDELFKTFVLDSIRIAKNANQPMFVFWSPHIAHVSHEAKGPEDMLLQVPQKYIQRFAGIKNTYRRLYTSMVGYLDEAVGEVVVRHSTHPPGSGRPPQCFLGE